MPYADLDMLSPPARTLSRFTTTRVDATVLPGWVEGLFRGAAETMVRKLSAGVRPATLSMTRRNGLVLLRVFHPGADALSALDFQHATTSAYRAIQAQLDSMGMQPIRFWNVLPRIRTTYADGLDRYMVFNAGRFAAYSDWYGDVVAFDGALATASGVGFDGADLHVAVLAAQTAGYPVENPRQTRAYCYSARYGPMPPCFSRGILCDTNVSLPAFIVGGTSSVCGERSLHSDDVAAQAGETLRNIAALLEAAARQARLPLTDDFSPLTHLETLRIYLVNGSDAEVVLSTMNHEVGMLREPVEIVRADICRPELLVEIEGTATFSGEKASR